MDDVNIEILNYLTDEVRIKELTYESIEGEILKAFKFYSLSPAMQNVFVTMMNEMIDIEYINAMLIKYVEDNYPYDEKY